MKTDVGDIGVDSVNRPLWGRVAAEFAIEGWADPGELGALMAVADEMRGRPVLDLGVGGGRTVALMRLMSNDYLGVDYSPELVDLCRSRHPDVSVVLGDARDLHMVDTASKALVCFSNNGIDAVDHDGREQVLDEVARVLEFNGLFVYSTLNKDNPLFGAHPGTAEPISWVPGSLLPARLSGEQVGGINGDQDASWVRALRNWRQLSASVVDKGSWGIAPFAAHEFGLLTHFITLAGAIDELARRDFVVERVFSCDSPQPRSPEEPMTAMYMHLVARRR